MGTRIQFFDDLRMTMVILAMAGSISIGSFYTWAEGIALPVLFFISGYFSASSLRIRQLRPFFKKRWQRLGWVWLFGSFILAPQLAYLQSDSSDFLSFYSTHFWQDSFSQGPFWFLSILLTMTLLLMAAKKNFPHCLQHVASTKPSVVLLIGLVLADGLASHGAAQLWGNIWFHPLYILDLPAAHIISIVLYFLLGIYAMKHRWFSAHGYIPSPFWIIPFLAFSLLYFIMVLPVWLISLVKAILPLTALLGLLGCLAYFRSKQPNILITFTGLSYPIYFLSQSLLQNTAWFIHPLAVSPWLKFLLIGGLSLIYAYMLSKYVLHKLPPFKKDS